MNIIQRMLTGAVLVIATLTLLVALPATVSACILGVVALYTLIVEWPAFKAPLLTPLYPLAPLALLLYSTAYTSRIELLWLIIIIAAHDTGAYISGNLWGKHKLLSTVSPKKTWEGLLGGLLCSLLAATIANSALAEPRILSKLPTSLFILVIALVNIAGVIGDLFESWLKRRAGLKDSGTILPGHGGILDRIDSLMIALPIWLLLKQLL